MQRIIPIEPKANPIGSTHSVAELGALASGNTTSTGSTSYYTRPVASVPLPTPPTTRPVASVPQPAPVQNSPVFVGRPIASPVGVEPTIGSNQLSTPLGRPSPYPVNYNKGVEE
jgi:hypothetical protein